MSKGKKIAGMAVLRNGSAASGLIGRIVSPEERDALLVQFADRFKKPVLIGQNYAIGDVKSDTGIGFKALPESAIFGSILTCADNDCEFMVYADAELDEAMDVVNALGGITTFTEPVVHFGNIYSATYPGGSGSWDPICIPPNK